MKTGPKHNTNSSLQELIFACSRPENHHFENNFMTQITNVKLETRLEFYPERLVAVMCPSSK